MKNRELTRRSRPQELAPWGRLRDEMDRWFGDFFRPLDLWPMPYEPRLTEFVPRIDLDEGEKELTITAELPGLNEKDVQVYVENDALIIEGEKKEEHEREERGWRHVERSYGSFRREIPLPTAVEADKTDASFHNGVLTVKLPKGPEAERKRVPVKVG